MEDFSKEQQDELNKSVQDLSDERLSASDKERLRKIRLELGVELRKAQDIEECERIMNNIYEVDSMLNS
jgi:hypothetical protein